MLALQKPKDLRVLCRVLLIGFCVNSMDLVANVVCATDKETYKQYMAECCDIFLLLQYQPALGMGVDA